MIPEPFVVCGVCPSCLAGLPNLCEADGFLGLSDNNGGFGEYANFTEKFIHKMPDIMTYEQAAIVEPIAVGYHALKVGDFKTDQTAIVGGAGPIGLAVIASLKVCGAKTIIAIEKKGSVREKIAKQLGADIVLDTSFDDVATIVKEITGGKGADIAFETTSAPVIFDTLYNNIKAQGTVVIIAIYPKPVTVSFKNMVSKEKRIVGSNCYNRTDFEEVIELIASGKMNVDGYVTKKILLDDIIEEGFGTLLGENRASEVKILATSEPELLK